MRIIREAKPSEYDPLGLIMVEVYSQLEGFPSPDEIPDYYNTLRNVGELVNKPMVKLFVSVSKTGQVEGGLVYFGDMKHYGAGGEKVENQSAAAFRLLAVKPELRGKGVGKLLIEACFEQAKTEGHQFLIIHSTKYMMVAWRMYERMGFVPFPEINFEKSGVEVFGFKYNLQKNQPN